MSFWKLSGWLPTFGLRKCNKDPALADRPERVNRAGKAANRDLERAEAVARPVSALALSGLPRSGGASALLVLLSWFLDIGSESGM